MSGEEAAGVVCGDRGVDGGEVEVEGGGERCRAGRGCGEVLEEGDLGEKLSLLGWCAGWCGVVGHEDLLLGVLAGYRAVVVHANERRSLALGHVAEILLCQLDGLVVIHAGKSHNYPVRLVKLFPVRLDDGAVDVGEALLRAEQRVAEGVVLVGSQVHQLRQDELRLVPDLANLVVGRLELLLYLVLGDERVAYCLGQQANCALDGRVEGRRLVHERLARRGTLNVAAQRLHLLRHLVAASFARRLEGEPVDDVAHATQRIVFVSRAGVNVNADAGKVAWQGLGRNADAIGECGDLIELDGVLLFGNLRGQSSSTRACGAACQLCRGVG
jgi:hypothetical protein